MSIGGASNKNINNILLKSKEDLRALKLHNLPYPLITLLTKNIRKLPQFLARDLS
jgi:glycosyltransferase